MAPELRELKEEPGLQRSTAGWRGRLQPWHSVKVEERHVVVERTTAQVAAQERLRRRRSRSAWAATQERRPTAQEPELHALGEMGTGVGEEKKKIREREEQRACVVWSVTSVCCVRAWCGVVGVHVRECGVWCVQRAWESGLGEG